MRLIVGDYRLEQSPDDVVITLAVRTPMAKGFKGSFKDTEFDYMLYALLKEVVARSNLDPALVEDIVLGCVCPTSPPSIHISHN